MVVPRHQADSMTLAGPNIWACHFFARLPFSGLAARSTSWKLRALWLNWEIKAPFYFGFPRFFGPPFRLLGVSTARPGRRAERAPPRKCGARSLGASEPRVRWVSLGVPHLRLDPQNNCGFPRGFILHTPIAASQQK